MIRWLAASLCLLGLTGCIYIDAEDSVPEERLVISTVKEPIEGVTNPLDLRRTTLIVQDIEASLAFYRDALGMTVAYDQELTSPGLTSRANHDGENRSRLVLLEANNSFIGMLGLWQFLDQEPVSEQARKVDFTPGNIVLLFNSKTLSETFPTAASVPGAEILDEPHERRYPSESGDIVVMVSMLSDPDGHAVELNQLISDPRRQ
ncbi:MAG: VOC family protein [Pseudomonadota bacterium]